MFWCFIFLCETDFFRCSACAFDMSLLNYLLTYLLVHCVVSGSVQSGGQCVRHAVVVRQVGPSLRMSATSPSKETRPRMSVGRSVSRCSVGDEAIHSTPRGQDVSRKHVCQQHRTVSLAVVSFSAANCKARNSYNFPLLTT